MDNSYFRIYSWNVNGIRACVKKGFIDWLGSSEGSVVCLQETRARLDQLKETTHSPAGWKTVFTPAERGGYSGVGTFSKLPIDELDVGLGNPEFDIEGRVHALRFGKLWVVNGYFPNGKGKNRDNSRVDYKLKFYREVFAKWRDAFEAGEPILILGDFNTAHEEIDLARPKDNKSTSGFLMQERQELDRWLRAGYVDTFRHLHSEQEGAYSWWSQRAGVRARNVGWRIDYILASPGAMPFLKSADIHAEVMGSDHCPVSVTLDRAVLG